MFARAMSMMGIAVLAGALFSVGGVSSPALAAPFDQCESAFNVGGEGANCQVTVENFLNLDTGAESSTVTTLVCSGAANTVTTCAGEPTVQSFDTLTERVEQCNYSGEGGGGTLHCSVEMINTITGEGTTSAPTVNQCNNSFDSLPLPAGSACDPAQATTDATITQCNDSMNGGTQVSMNCTVGTSTTSSALPVTVNQCNNSVNGGGALLVCSTQITTLVLPADTDDEVADEGTGDDTVADDADVLAETGPTAVHAALGGLALALVLAGVGLLRARRPVQARRE
ncbi:hypothetical protein [Chryseoglobus sp. 28M-23]|uniref:hypothetical protein n=1 Tax=Chryseoglobus sp. 28M-23 TaxID=2772253 RepID=UPI001745E1EE|nr:hypothetical protein [Chryseoglobus sp. 28M-23]QOD92948.1 hypothetical protein IE160_08285 [Chryseoglobus sp. 28M-23]